MLIYEFTIAESQKLSPEFEEDPEPPLALDPRAAPASPFKVEERPEGRK